MKNVVIKRSGEQCQDDVKNGSRVQQRSNNQAGLSLLEILVGTVLLGILASMVVPTMGEFISVYRLNAQTDRFVSALSSARAEAITNNTPVTVCATLDDGSCSGNPDDWANQWSVFYDCNGNSRIDAGAVCDDGSSEPVYVFDRDAEAEWAFNMADADFEVPAKIDFDSSGSPISFSDCWGVAFTLSHENNAHARTVFLNNLGRIYVADTSEVTVTGDCQQIAMLTGTSSSGDSSGGTDGSSSGTTSSGGDSSGDGGSSSSGDTGGSSSGDSDSSSSGGDDGSSSGGDDDGSSSGDTGGSSGIGSSSSGDDDSSGSSSGDPGDEDPFCTDCEKEDYCTKVDAEVLDVGITIPLGNSGNFVTITGLDYKEDEKIGFTLLTNNNFQVKAGINVHTFDEESQVSGGIEWGYPDGTADNDAPAISHVIFCVPSTYELDGDYTGFPEWEP